jgi:hypothetical protein
MRKRHPWRDAAVCLVFSIHNGYNCFTFLNFTNFAPAAALLNITEPEVGLITTVGFIGILATLPAVALCRWHRTLLLFSGILNATAPILRYVAASGDDWSRTLRFQCILLSNFLQGGAFGVLGAWPAVLAAQWPTHRRTLVTAITSLSNYVGGSIGTLTMPLVANSAGSLLGVLRVQAFASIPLSLTLVTWVWIPPVGSDNPQDDSSGTPDHSSGRNGLRHMLRRCLCRRRPALTLTTLGVVVGVSLGLQGMIQGMLTGAGFTPVESGLANTLYQLSAAALGILVGGRVRSARSLVPTLSVLHAVAATAYLMLALLCSAVHSALSVGRLPFAAAPALMLVAAVLLGASLLGMLPFALQLSVHEAGVDENVSSSCVYLVAMAIAAGLVQVSASVGALVSVSLIGGLLGVEMALFLLLRRLILHGRAACRLTREPLLLPGGVAGARSQTQGQTAATADAVTSDIAHHSSGYSSEAARQRPGGEAGPL